ncbi:MAG: ATP-binding protein [Bacteroidales bacterium]|nr:ATP-binding protein [Bacteroidales bacterium]
MEALLEKLDDEWEERIVSTLPFPIAYRVNQFRKSDRNLKMLTIDVLECILRYFADIAISKYLYSTSHADTTINNSLVRLGDNVSTGHWLEIIRRCCKSESGTFEPLQRVFNLLENDKYSTRVRIPRLGSMNPDRSGLLSSWVFFRNKIFSHHGGSSAEEMSQTRDQLSKILRAVLFLSKEIWNLDFVKVFKLTDGVSPISLRGIGDFNRTELAKAYEENDCFLCSDNSIVLELWPFILVAPVVKKNVTIPFNQSDLFFLNGMRKRGKQKERIPDYYGLRGDEPKAKENSSILNKLFNDKKVWETKLESSTACSLFNMSDKLRMDLFEAHENQMYDSSTHMDRKSVSTIFSNFIENSDKRIMLLCGDSGSGKTASIMRMLDKRERADRLSIVIGCEKLPASILNSGELENFIRGEKITSQLGISEFLRGTLDLGKEEIVLVFERMNEFTCGVNSAGREAKDGSRLFERIIDFAYSHKSATNLKIICTFTTKSKDIFLPGNSLPYGVDQDLFHFSEDAVYFEFPRLTPSETREYLESLGVSEIRIDEYFNHSDELELNPLTLKSLVFSRPEGKLSGITDSEKIVSEHIEKVLAQNKGLEKTINQLLKLFKKEKGFVVLEEDLKRSDKQLYLKLTENNNSLLWELRNLGIIRVTYTLDEKGTRTWGVSVAHDRVYSVLTGIRSRKELKRNFISGALACFAMLLFSTFLVVSTVRTPLKDSLEIYVA